ncbi:hypothetical protein MXB_2317 [Myxobolus squamalis]|nr:hypothetical protein MXB_2317 [Myxobolus squamalis]
MFDLSRVTAGDVNPEIFNLKLFYNFALFVMIKLSLNKDYDLKKDIDYLLTPNSWIIIKDIKITEKKYTFYYVKIPYIALMVHKDNLNSAWLSSSKNNGMHEKI